MTNSYTQIAQIPRYLSVLVVFGFLKLKLEMIFGYACIPLVRAELRCVWTCIISQRTRHQHTIIPHHSITFAANIFPC